MSDTPTPAPEKAVHEAPSPAVTAPKPERPRVSANPALVEWPADEFGSMSLLRTELLRVASNIRGASDKQALFLATLGVAAQHAQARFKNDAREVELTLAAEDARIDRHNRYGRSFGLAVS